MLSLSALDAILTISEVELIDGLLVAILAAPQVTAFFSRYPRLKQALLAEMPEWKSRFKHTLAKAGVPPILEKEFSLYQQSLSLSANLFYPQLPELLKQLHSLQSAFAEAATTLVDNADLAHSSTPGSSLQMLFLQQWRESLTQQVIELHYQLLEQQQEQLLAELQQRMALSGDLDSLFSENDAAAGRLWDMSKSTLHQGNHKLLLEYGEVLQQQPELQQLAQQLGRSHSAKAVPKDDAQAEMYRVLIREPAAVPEQVNGIQQSDDILRLLPSELAVLGIEALEYEFYRRLLERNLLTYRLQGDGWREKTLMRQVVHQQQGQQPRGPFVVCVDTSGSMGGFNESCAKAFCLALLRIALADNRRCYVMLFASEVVQYELTGPQGLEQAIRFLGQHFHGGTDLTACLAQTLTKMREAAWQDADAVVISDFIAQHLPEPVVKQVKQQQQALHQRFHAVAMSNYGKPGVMHIFDHIWRFDTGLKSRLLRRWRRT